MTDRTGWATSASAPNLSDSLRKTSLPEATDTAGIEASQPRLRSSDSTRAPPTSEMIAQLTPATTYSQNDVSKIPSASHNQINDQHTNAVDAAPLNATAQEEAGVDKLAGAKSTGDIHRANDKKNDNEYQKATRLLSPDEQQAEDAVDVSTPWDAHGTPARFKMVIR